MPKIIILEIHLRKGPWSISSWDVDPQTNDWENEDNWRNEKNIGSGRFYNKEGAIREAKKIEGLELFTETIYHREKREIKIVVREKDGQWGELD